MECKILHKINSSSGIQCSHQLEFLITDVSALVKIYNEILSSTEIDDEDISDTWNQDILSHKWSRNIYKYWLVIGNEFSVEICDC